MNFAYKNLLGSSGTACQMPSAASTEACIHCQAKTCRQELLLFTYTLSFFTADVTVLAAAARSISGYEYAGFTSHSYHYTNSLMRGRLAVILGKSDDSRKFSTATQRSYPDVTTWRS